MTLFLTWNKKINAWSFDVNINQCSKNCELMQNGLKPYCISLKERFKNFIAWHKKLDENEKAIKKANFERLMIIEIKEKRANLIRVYSYGDLSCVGDLIKWSNIALKNPGVKFWLSTRQDYILNLYFLKMKLLKPDNLIIRYSLPLIKIPKFLSDFLDKYDIVKSDITPDKKEANCKKSTLNSNCGTCSDCWDASKKIIKYFNHGQMQFRLSYYLRALL